MLLCAVVLPMLIPRSLTAVSRFSRMSIAMVLVLATTICSLAVLAVSQVGGPALVGALTQPL